VLEAVLKDSYAMGLAAPIPNQAGPRFDTRRTGKLRIRIHLEFAGKCAKALARGWAKPTMGLILLPMGKKLDQQTCARLTRRGYSEQFILEGKQLRFGHSRQERKSILDLCGHADLQQWSVTWTLCSPQESGPRQEGQHGSTWSAEKDPDAVLPQNPAQCANFQLIMRFDATAASRFL
jgi:hypothetical protein